MSVCTALLILLLASVIVMTLTWALQRRHGNAGYVDVVWAALMGASAIWLSAVGQGAALPRLLAALLGGIWGFRLSLHLLGRVLGEAEDGRYRYLREYWQGDQRKLFGFYMFQAISVPLFALPFLAVAANPQPAFSVWTLAGVLVWLGGLVGESIADAQLSRFRKQPGNRGRTCRSGLWRYSRHPNYFFEWLHWFGYALLAIGSPWWWLGLSGPLLMGASLRWLSGIPYTEAQALRSRGEDYRAYQRETSMFFPWPPRSPH
ncbi:MAG: DUF1295 domain-containing protein [Lysobacteraceae bacterium]